MRWAAKVDANQSPIVAEFRRLGASVFASHKVGAGFPDLVVGYDGRTLLVEVKLPKGKLSPSQVKFMADWNGSPVHIARHITDCEKILKS